MLRKTPYLVAVAASLSILAPPSAARADAGRCQRTINLAAAAFAKTKIRIVDTCKRNAVRIGVPASPTDCPLSPQEDRINAAEERMRKRIARACGGANKVCSAADVNADADVALADIGWDIPTCPDLSGQGCVNPIADCNDIATCLLCVGHEAVNQPIDLAYDLMTAAEFGSGSVVNLCQVAVGKETAKIVRLGMSQIAGCWNRVLLGKAGYTTPPGCPATNAPTVERLANAEGKMIDQMCKACGAGGDADRDGACDVPGLAISPSAIGFEPDCPDKTVPGSPTSCGRVVTTLDDMIACIDCLADFEVACSTDLAVPTRAAYPAECTLVP